MSTKTGVTTKQIRQWVKEERLILSENSVEGIECESCGKRIRTGRYCEACKAALSNNLMNAIEKPKRAPQKKTDRERDRMRFIQK